MEAKLKCSKNEFLDYEAVRKSGVTNMFAIKTVEQLTGLNQFNLFFAGIHHLLLYLSKSLSFAIR